MFPRETKVSFLRSLSLILLIALSLIWSQVSISESANPPKVKVMVFEFQDLTNTGAGTPIPQYIVRLLGSDPKFEVTFVPLYKLPNHSLQAMMEYAKSNGYHFIITGRVTDSNVTYHSASVPTPFGGVSVRSATATVSFLASLKTVNGETIIERNFTGSETVSNVGGWAWTSWGYVDIYSDSFLSSPMGKALDKAAKEMVKTIYKKLPDIQKIASRFSSTTSPKTELLNSSGTKRSDKYEMVKVYENDFTGVSLGTTFIKGVKQMDNRDRVSTEECGNNLNCPSLSTGRGLILKLEPLKPPFEVDFKIIGKQRWGKLAVIHLGKHELIEGRYTLTKGIRVEFIDVFESGARVVAYLVTKQGDRIEDLKIAYKNFNYIRGKESMGKVLLTRNKLKIYVNGATVLDIDLPEEVLENLPSRFEVSISGDGSLLKHISVSKLKVKSESREVGTSTDKVKDIIYSLERLGGEVTRSAGYVEIKFRESDLFTGAVNPEPSEKFEDILDTIDDLVIALGAESVKVKLRTKYTARSQEVLTKEKSLIKDYLTELASGNYKVKVLKGSSAQEKGTVIFKVRI